MLLLGIDSALWIHRFHQPQFKNMNTIYNYLCIIYIVIHIISNLEMIESIREDVCRLYANAMPLYIRNLSFCRFRHSGRLEALESMLHGHPGQPQCRKTKTHLSHTQAQTIKVSIGTFLFSLHSWTKPTFLDPSRCEHRASEMVTGDASGQRVSYISSKQETWQLQTPWVHCRHNSH